MCSVSHHSNRKIIVHDFIWDRVSSILRVFWSHSDAPAIQKGLLTSLNLLQDFPQVRSLISLQEVQGDNIDLHIWVINAWKRIMLGFFLPPPQRRQRAMSFPVPRGSTATGGFTEIFALSETTYISSFLFSDGSSGLSCKFRRTRNTYSIQKPPDCAISPTHQDPELTQISKEV